MIVSLITLNVFSQTSESNKKRFKDFYNLTEINKAEVSLFKEDNYKSVDEYEKLIEFIKCSKKVVSKFIPYKELVLYDKNGSKYMILFSSDFQRIKIDGRTFAINKKKSKEISKILSQ